MYDYGYGSAMGNPSDALGILGFLTAFAGIIGLLSLIATIIILISTWKIYTKAGKPGWASIIPIYNFVVLLEMVELPLWYIALLIVPIANIYAIFKIYIALAHRFGKSTGFGIATVFFGIICIPILAFNKNCIYEGNGTNQVSVNTVNQTVPTQFSNNNFQNENPTPAGIQMFNQNINTNINQINQNNQIQQPLFEPPMMTQNNIVSDNNEVINNKVNEPQLQMNTQTVNTNTTSLPNNDEQGLFVYKPNHQQPAQSEPLQQPINPNSFGSQNVVNTINSNLQQVNSNNNQNNPMM